MAQAENQAMPFAFRSRFAQLHMPSAPVEVLHAPAGPCPLSKQGLKMGRAFLGLPRLVQLLVY